MDELSETPLSPPVYFSKEMQQEFHVTYANKIAQKMIHSVENKKKLSFLEKHVANKYKSQPSTSSIMGS